MQLKLKGLLIVSLLLAVMVFFYLWFTSEQRVIKRVVHMAEEATEDRDIGAFMEIVSIHYRDRYGFTYLRIKKLIGDLFQRAEAMEVSLDDIDVEVNDDVAEVHLRARVLLRRDNEEEYLIGSAGVAESVIVWFQKEMLRWRVKEVYFPMREGLI